MEQITGTYTIKQIFQDHWKRFLIDHPETRGYVVENVEKMLACRDSKRSGYVKYACTTHPEQMTVIPRSCKSRFCNACGKIAVDRWLVEACDNFPNVPYGHVTFTVPSELRPLLKERPELRSLLFEVSSKIVLAWCRTRGWVPAITAVLHTFGRDLKFHPHIHMLVSAGGLDQKTKTRWIDCTYLPAGMLTAQWKTRLLYRFYGDRLISHRLKRMLFRIKWYLNVAATLMLPVVTTNYVGRYTKRPPLAEARITHYDRRTVVFQFSDWISGGTVQSRMVTVMEFIALLTQHIPPKHFRLIRHYGLLHNRVRSRYRETVKRLFGTIIVLRPVDDWRTRQQAYRGNDPLRCGVCQKEMVPVEVAYWSRTIQQLVVRSL